jgi:hypothetical protein
MYRPAGITYLVLLFKAFGELAWPCHVLALCIHVLNSAMVFGIMRKLTEDQVIAVLCGLIYASAVAVHLDPLCWAVGIYDLGGAFFFFASIASFLSGRTLSSLLFFFVGTLFKEPTIVLPAVLAVLEPVRVREWDRKECGRVVRRLLPFLVLCALIVATKLTACRSPISLPASHPYVLDPIGRHVIDNAYRYFGWMLQALIPFGSVHSNLFRIALSVLALLVVVVAMLRRSGRTTRLFAGLLFWMLLSLLPVMLLPNHSFRYYATYSLPPFICTVLLLAKETLALVGLRERSNRVLAVAGTLIVLLSIVQSNRVFRQGLQYRTLSDGTNDLIRRAGSIEVVRSSLLRELPSPGEGATILLSGVDLWDFNKDSGPQVWYGNPSIRVYDLAALRYSSDGFHIESPIQSQEEAYTPEKRRPIHVDAARLFAFRSSGDRLQAVAPAELRRIAEMQTGAALMRTIRGAP